MFFPMIIEVDIAFIDPKRKPQLNAGVNQRPGMVCRGQRLNYWRSV